MKVLNKLVKQNLIKNKQRTVVSIIGIVLSCALITALFGLVVSMQESLKEDSLKSFGNRHVTFENVPKEDIKHIANNKNVESYYLTGMETAKIDGNLSGVITLDKTAAEGFKNLMVDGDVPKDENEIVINAFYADENKVKIGEEVSLEFGKRKIDGYVLGDNNPYQKKEIFEIDKTKTYKVVGISNTYSYLGSMHDIDVFILDSKDSKTYNMHTLYNDPKNYDKITASINGTKKDTDKGKYNTSYNREYLRWAGYSVGDSKKGVVTALAGIVTFIIIVVSVICISNSFIISVAEKTRTYGMLSSIGATPKQIKKSVLKEGWYLGIIGVPLGILSGILASYILVIVTTAIFESINGLNFDLNYKISFLSIITAVALSFVTIYLSAIGSARRASKITEIEAIKNQKEIKLKSKKLKTPKIIKKIFKTGGVLAYKNMKRNKSKYRATIIALTVSITSFIAISYFIDIGLSGVTDMFDNFKFNMIVEAVSETHEYSKEEEKIYNHISKLDNIDKFSILKSKSVRLDKECVVSLPNEENESAYIFSVNKEEYNRFLSEAKLKYKDVKDKGIVVLNEKSYQDTSSLLKENIDNIKYTDYKKEVEGNIDIIYSDKGFMGLEEFEGRGMPGILVSEEYFNKIDAESNYEKIYMYSKDTKELKNSINKYEEKEDLTCSLNVTDISEIVKQQKTIVLIFSIFLYGFISVITLIGITNIFNTITTNMMLRSREFAILKSTGMTDKEFINMIRLESLFYGLKSLSYGLFFGVGLSYSMYKSVSASDLNNLLLSCVPPYKSIIISIIFVFLIVNLIMRYSLSKINKQNIIETIRNENI